MFAVLKTGGKQYKVTSGDVLKVEKLAASEGQTVQFNDILMVQGKKTIVGSPFVKDAAVQAEVLGQIRGEKVINFVKRRRKHSSQRTKGHRQYLTVLRVTDILETGGEKSGVASALNGAGFTSIVSEVAKKPVAAVKKPAPAAVAKKPAAAAKKPAAAVKKPAPAAAAKKPAAAVKKPAPAAAAKKPAAAVKKPAPAAAAKKPAAAVK
jgi:large subunit ribosomal protein L21